MKLNEKIAILRKARGFTQEGLGLNLSTKEYGVSRQTVSEWEKGSSEPKLENVRALAKLLQVSYDALLDEELDLNNPEYLRQVLDGTYGKTSEVLSEDSYFISKKNYNIPLLVFSILLVAVAIVTIVLSYNKAQLFFALAKEKNGDESVMGQALNNRGYIWLVIALLGGLILLVPTPILIYQFIKSFSKNKSVGMINEKELVLYPNATKKQNKTKHIPLLEISDIQKEGFDSTYINLHNGEKVLLKHIKDRDLFISSYEELKM